MLETTRVLGTKQPVQPSQMRTNNGPIFVCMGQSGAGKTTLLETLNDSEYTPVGVADVDGKAHVLTDRADRDIYPCHTWEDLDGLVQALLADRLKPKYNTFCFDGTTAMQQVLAYNKHKIKQQTNPQVRQSAYGNANLDMVDLAQSARLLAEAGMHIIFNIWSVREKEEGSELVRITPDLTTTLLNRFLGLFDYVVYLEPNAQPKPYPPVMYWGGSVTRATRNASSPESPLSKVPERMVNPSWRNIFDAYHGKGTLAGGNQS